MGDAPIHPDDFWIVFVGIVALVIILGATAAFFTNRRRKEKE